MPVRAHTLVNVRIDAALDDPIARHIFGEVDLRDFVRFEQEDVVIRNPVDRKAFMNEGNRQIRILVEDVILIRIGAIRRKGAVILVGKHVLSAVRRLVVDLVRELGDDRFCAVHTKQLLAQLNCSGPYRCQVEAHMKVGSSRASLQVENAHRMGGIWLEDPLSVFILHEALRHIGFGLRRSVASVNIIVVKQVSQGRPFPVDVHLSGAEVDRARNRAVDASQVDDQLSVHVEPEIVVSRELEDDVMSPVVKSVGCLREGCLQLHAKIAIDLLSSVLEGVKALVFSRIAVRKELSLRVVEVVAVNSGEYARLEVIVREELPVFERIAAAY